ncbi:MAG: V-type ATPase subunit [Candidatus Micrarchaeaceae archaeon]
MKAVEYGYANARVKAMESMLLSNDLIQKMRSARSVDELVPMLYDTAYKRNLIEFGGLNIKSSLLDFAINKNLSESVEKLVRITPNRYRKLMQALVSKWDFANAKLAIEAKARGIAYDKISDYVTDRGPFNAIVIKEALGKKDISELLEFLAIRAPSSYKEVIAKAAQAYEKNKNPFAAIDAIDLNSYALVGAVARALFADDTKAARIVKISIDIQNMITLIRAKANNATFESVEQRLLKSGSISIAELADTYAKANTVDEFVGAVKQKGFANGLDAYNKTGSLTQLEIGMRKQLLEKSRGMLAEVLSFAAILAYAYVKELEAINLRVIIKSKQYMLSESELNELVIA